MEEEQKEEQQEQHGQQEAEQKKEEKHMPTQGFLFKLKRFYIECLRVLKVTKKPNGIEFKTIVKVSGLGILIIGLMGFIVAMIKQLLFQ